MDSLTQLCKTLDLSEPARALVDDSLTCDELIQLLAEDHGLYADAIRVQARALSKPQAVAWACRCIRRTLTQLNEQEREALARAEEWFRDPSEERRRAAKPAADAVGLTHPAGAVALAAFLSGGSLAPPHLPAIPPAEYLTAKAAAGAVLLAAVVDQPGEPAERYTQFLDWVQG